MSTVAPGETNTEVVVDPVLDAAPSDNDRGHFVCCREAAGDEQTLTTFCGQPTSRDDLEVVSGQLCEACLEVGESLMRLKIVGKQVSEKYTCIRDGSDCPTGEEADDLWKGMLGIE